jgi:ribosome biogenesis GTPase / thiamine phosphate phosphatase
MFLQLASGQVFLRKFKGNREMKNEINSSDDSNPMELLTARITSVHKGMYKAICLYGEINVKLKGKLSRESNEGGIVPVVGDLVCVQYHRLGESLITEIFERTTSFVRTDFRGHKAGYVKTIQPQVLAANFDIVFILASVNEEFNLHRIERYLSTALSSRAEVVIVLTKSDLVENADDYVMTVKQHFPFVECFAISVKSGQNMEGISRYISKGKIVVFLGSSGVGKSSLFNYLANGPVMAVREIREQDARGRHTTSHRQLTVLKNGAMIIDTPGIRELGLWDAKEGLSEVFSDIEEYICKCRFSNCKHLGEPGCHVQMMLDEGALTLERWHRYLSLQKENEWGKKKSPPAKRRI